MVPDAGGDQEPAMSDQPVRYIVCDDSEGYQIGSINGEEVVLASAFDAVWEENKRLRDALKRAKELVCLVTVKQVLEAGDAAINAAGLNPWCINEGLADGTEYIQTDFIDRALHGERGT